MMNVLNEKKHVALVALLCCVGANLSAMDKSGPLECSDFGMSLRLEALALEKQVGTNVPKVQGAELLGELQKSPMERLRDVVAKIEKVLPGGVNQYEDSVKGKFLSELRKAIVVVVESKQSVPEDARKLLQKLYGSSAEDPTKKKRKLNR